MKTIKFLAFAFIFAGSVHAMEQAAPESPDDLAQQMYFAIWYNQIELVKELLEGGIDVNCAIEIPMGDGTRINTALTCVIIQGGKFEICELLLKAGAKINVKIEPLVNNCRTMNDLECATAHGHYRMGELLIEAMLNTPSEKQKNGIYAFLHCLKCMYPGQYHNLCDVFRAPLRAMIREENAADPMSLAREQVNFLCKEGYSVGRVFLQKHFTVKERRV